MITFENFSSNSKALVHVQWSLESCRKSKSSERSHLTLEPLNGKMPVDRTLSMRAARASGIAQFIGYHLVISIREFKPESGKRKQFRFYPFMVPQDLHQLKEIQETLGRPVIVSGHSGRKPADRELTDNAGKGTLPCAPISPHKLLGRDS